MKKIAIILSLIVLFLTACQQVSQNKVDELYVKVEKPQIMIYRYEKAIFNLNPAKLRAGLSNISQQYKFFLGDDWQDTMNLLRMYNFISDQNIRSLYKLTVQKFPDTTLLRNDLQKAFEIFLESYPGKKMPKVFTYVSGLDIELPVIYVDTIMAISLDLFLGSDVMEYKAAGIPEYKIARLSREHLMPACMLAVADSLVKKNMDNQNLLDQMVGDGKALYFLDLTLPEVNDEFKIGYTSDKLKWCKENEGNIWSFLIGNQFLYSSDPQITGKLLVDAPFTSGFSSDSPGRLGSWMGWQIIRAYMKENPSVTLPDLMNNTNSQKILKDSRYKPQK